MAGEAEAQNYLGIHYTQGRGIDGALVGRGSQVVPTAAAHSLEYEQSASGGRAEHERSTRSGGRAEGERNDD